MAELLPDESGSPGVLSFVIRFKQLIWGITGEKPREQSHVSSATNPAAARRADYVQGLLPRKEKVTIEIRLPGNNIDEFSAEERDSKFLNRFR